MKPQLVLVEWEDSRQPTTGWRWLRSDDKWTCVVIRSVGFVVASDERTLVLAPNLSEPDDEGDRQACGMMQIPHRCIVRVVDLGEANLAALASFDGEPAT